MNIHNLVSGLSVEDIVELLPALEFQLKRQSYPFASIGKKLRLITEELKKELDRELKLQYQLNDEEKLLIAKGTRVKAIQAC